MMAALLVILWIFSSCRCTWYTIPTISLLLSLCTDFTGLMKMKQIPHDQRLTQRIHPLDRYTFLGQLPSSHIHPMSYTLWT